MRHIPHADDRSPVRASFWNAVAAYIRAGYIQVVEPLAVRYSGSTVTLSLEQPIGFWARITTNIDPASWVELEWIQATHSFITKPDGRHGDYNAYISHSGAVPVEKVVWMQEGYSGKDWRYSFIRRQTSDCDTQICITLDSCFIFASSNTALIEVKQGATVIGSCTVDINTYTTTPCCIVVPGGGSYDIKVTPSTPTQLGWTRTVSVAECMTAHFTYRVYPATFTACCGVEGCPGIDGNPGNGPVGTVVDFRDHDGDIVDSCVLDSSGECCITVDNDALTGPPPFPWTVTATPPPDSGYLPNSTSTNNGIISPDPVHGCGATFGIQLEVDEDHVCCACGSHTEPVHRTIEYTDACGATGTLTWGDWRIGASGTFYRGWGGCLEYAESSGSAVNSYGYCVGPQPITATIFVILFCQAQDIVDGFGVTRHVRALKAFPYCLDSYTNAPFGPNITYIFPASPDGDCSGRLTGSWRYVYLPDDDSYCDRPINISGLWTDYIDGVELVVDTETTMSFIES